MATPLKSARTCAIILAAGQSIRMGVPKLSLAFRRKTSFLEQCVSQFHAFGCSKVVVVINSEGLQWVKDHKPHIKKKARLVLNSYPERGRLFSLQLGLEKSDIVHGLFIHNVDNPFVSQEVLQSIWDTSLENTDFDYISPRYKGQGGHPIMISETLARSIIEEPSNKSLKQILSAYECTHVEVDDPYILTNINTIEEYQKAACPENDFHHNKACYSGYHGSSGWPSERRDDQRHTEEHP